MIFTFPGAWYGKGAPSEDCGQILWTRNYTTSHGCSGRTFRAKCRERNALGSRSSFQMDRIYELSMRLALKEEERPKKVQGPQCLSVVFATQTTSNKLPLWREPAE
jgi:hypothetical protein